MTKTTKGSLRKNVFERRTSTREVNPFPLYHAMTVSNLKCSVALVLQRRFAPNREVKHHVYVQRLVRIYTTLPSFPFTCRLLFITSTRKLVVSRNFLSIRIVVSCFYVLIFYFEKFSAWIWRLSFAVYAKLKLSNIWAQLLSKHAKKSSSAGLTCVAAARRRFCLSPLKFSLVRGFLWRESPLVGGGGGPHSAP